MGEFIQWICLFLNIDAKNSLVLCDITEEIERYSIEDIVAFKEFIKQNKSHTDLQYENGLGKFYKIAEMFIQEKYKHITDDIDLKAQELRKKFNQAFNTQTRDVFLDKDFHFRLVKQEDEFYFTDKELFILNKIPKNKLYGLSQDNYILEFKIKEIMKREANKYIHSRASVGSRIENKQVSSTKVLMMVKKVKKERIENTVTEKGLFDE